MEPTARGNMCEEMRLLIGNQVRAEQAEKVSCGTE